MLYQLLPKNTYQFDQEAMLMMLKGLAAKDKKKSFLKRLLHDLEYTFIVDCDAKGKISFYFRCEEEKKDMVKSILDVFLKDGGDAYSIGQELKTYVAVDTLYLPKQSNSQTQQSKQNATLATYKNDAVFMTVLGMLMPKTRLEISFKVASAAVSNGNARYAIFRSSNDVELQALIRVLGETKYERTEIMRITNQICTLTAGERSFRADYKDSYKESTISGAEIMNLFQLPTLYRKEEKQIGNIYHLLPGQKTLDVHEFSTGLKFGQLYHPQMTRDVYVDLSQLRKHLLITGATGSGKSSAIEENIDDILLRIVKGEKNVPGFTFNDPAETSVLGVIDKTLKLQSEGYDINPLLEKMHYIDFSYEECVFPITLLNKKIKSTEIIDFFQSLFGDQKTIQVDRMVTSSINALLNDDLEHTIDDISKIFLDAEFREELRGRLRGNMYSKDSLAFLESKFNSSQVEPILNRLDPFKNTRQKKLMFGMTSQHDSLKDIRKWMDNGDIILINIKGVNNFDRNVICGYMAMQYYQQALTRPANALIHFMINDESHHLQLPIYPRIAAELRKQGLSLVLMTQFLQQYSPDYLKQLLDNINTIVSFKQGDTAAMTLARTIRSGDVTADALKSLSTFIGYVSTEDNDKEKSVLIKVRPPYRYTDGKEVPYENQKAVEANEKKNREFARKLMARDYMSRAEAEQIVFAQHFADESLLEEEKQLLISGDSMLSINSSTENYKNQNEKIESEDILEWDD